MGIRQTAQPLGIAVGALVIPELAEHGPRAGLMFPVLACAVGAVASLIGIVDPPRKPREAASEQELASPYRGSLVLWRIHAVAGLMMMPQTVTVTFMLVWLIKNLYGRSPQPALWSPFRSCSARSGASWWAAGRTGLAHEWDLSASSPSRPP
jgi:hypothetical protein